MNEHETFADIIAEMRRGTRLPGYWRSCYVNKILQYHADRLEAAHKRESAKAKAALAAPPRNCDVAQDWLRDLYVNFKPPASVKREMPPEWVDAVMAFCRWLVAPATEKEGGNDADK